MARWTADLGAWRARPEEAAAGESREQASREAARAEAADLSSHVTAMGGPRNYFSGPASMPTWQPFTLTAASTVLSMLQSGQDRASLRAAVEGLMYGYIDAADWTAWRNYGVELRVLLPGTVPEDATACVKWFDDRLAEQAFGAAPSRRCELFLLDADGRKYFRQYDGSGRGREPATELRDDFVVVPTLSGSAPLAPDEIAWWLSPLAGLSLSVPAGPPPRRALDLWDGT